ncbi:MAG: hypothetical protein KME05_23995 [Gloeocapsa sp. UFS-A4-WI-NPMV-4B04]|jgi:hypothetical protein|nr:hypothetical protein [Gloeocapsa sp. UFS-A4-WI-NPMV-4B04]
MPKTKLRAQSTSGNYETRLAVAQSFNRGDRVRHRVTGKLGVFQEINLGYALAEVWVQFDSDNEIVIPTSCNPLDLELLNSEFNQQAEIQPVPELEEARAIPVVVVELLEELTPQEAAERHRLELKVERAFYEAGIALRQLREQRLYRSTHRNFEDYCQDRFGMTRRKGDYLITAAGVFENLEMRTNCSQILPTNESQVRPLTTLESPDEQMEVWQQAVEQAGNKVPSGRIVKGIVERLKEKPLIRATDFCSTGDVFTLIRLEGAERKYNGCWAIASHINDFTLEVDVYERTFTVKPENLKQIDEPDVRRQLPQTLKRIRRLRNVGLLDRGAYYVLEGLGRQLYLTDFEDDLLTFIEQRYGIQD